MQRYQIFINEKPLRLLRPEKTPPQKGRVVLHHKSAAELFPWLQKLESDTHLQAVYAICYRPAEVFEQLLAMLPSIDAAGGVVWQNGKCLFIYRHKRWDLPKGKIEPSELPDLAALREVEEECGINQLELGDFLAHSYHTYRFQGELMLKRTHWYHMESAFDGTLVPQIEEGIEEVRWIAPEEFESLVFANTYLSIAELIKNEVLPRFKTVPKSNEIETAPKGL